jgi:putative transposase
MIERCRDAFPTRMMCRLLKVSPQGFYDWRDREPSKRALEDRELLDRIGTLHEESDGVKGAPRIHDDLRDEGYRCGKNRVARLMRENSLQGIPQKRRWRSKKSEPRPLGVRNELERVFSSDQRNEKWVTDITYIKTDESTLYLCIVKDLCDGQIVGWSMSHQQTREVVIQAVLMALWQRSDREPLIIHSDRGTQFTSNEYQKFLKGHNVTCSMSAVGSCADNASAESFFGQLKRERINRRRYTTRNEARADIFDYIERFYNPERRKQFDRKNNPRLPFTKPSVETG